jgi:putative transposase
VSELAAAGARIRVPVAVTCRVLKLHRQHYYAWLACPVTDAEWTQAHRADAIFSAHRDDPEFGYRFLLDEARDAGQSMAERTAWRICADNGWWSRFGKKERYARARVGAPAHDDLVRREFTAPAPNRVWLSDLTEHPTREGKLYVCAIKDVWSRRIVGYSISEPFPTSVRCGRGGCWTAGSSW